MKVPKLCSLILGTLFVIGIDHWSKVLILMTKNDLPITVMPFLNLVFVKNRGISFGFFQAGTSAQVFLLCGFSAVIALGILVWYLRSQRFLLSGGLIMILGGALGNMIDRLLWGGVIDFLDFYVGIWHFPAFNVADACITCGTGLVFLDQMMEKSSTVCKG